MGIKYQKGVINSNIKIIFSPGGGGIIIYPWIVFWHRLPLKRPKFSFNFKPIFVFDKRKIFIKTVCKIYQLKNRKFFIGKFWADIINVDKQKSVQNLGSGMNQGFLRDKVFLLIIFCRRRECCRLWVVSRSLARYPVCLDQGIIFLPLSYPHHPHFFPPPPPLPCYRLPARTKTGRIGDLWWVYQR